MYVKMLKCMLKKEPIITSSGISLKSATQHLLTNFWMTLFAVSINKAFHLPLTIIGSCLGKYAIQIIFSCSKLHLHFCMVNDSSKRYSHEQLQAYLCREKQTTSNMIWLKSSTLSLIGLLWENDWSSDAPRN